MKIKYLAGIALMASALPQLASAQTVVRNNSTVVNVGGVSAFDVFFNELVGMKITWTTTASGACFAGCSGTFANLGGGQYGISSADFSLSTTGFADTYGLLNPYQWSLTGKYLTGFTMDALSVDAAFDTWDGVVGTPGSNVGRTFSECGFFCLTGDQWGTTATFSNEVAVSPNAPVGDLYGFLSVAFSKPFETDTKFGRNTFVSNASVGFSSDLDFVERVSTPQEVAPEPAEMTMLATGLVGLAGFGARRRRKA